MTENAPDRPMLPLRTATLRMIGVYGLLIGLLFAVLLWSWIAAVAAVGVFVGTAAVDSFWTEVERLRS